MPEADPLLEAAAGLMREGAEERVARLAVRSVEEVAMKLAVVVSTDINNWASLAAAATMRRRLTSMSGEARASTGSKKLASLALAICVASSYPLPSSCRS